MPERNTTEIQLCSAGGVNVPFVEYGERDERPPFVILHGISMPVTHWVGFPAAMERHTIALGLPASNPYEVPVIDNYAKNVLPAIRELAGDEYDLLGLSWGGLLAQQLAIDDRKHVRRLVLAGTIPAAPVPYLDVPNFKAIMSVMSTKRSAKAAGDVYGGDFRNNPVLAAELGQLISRSINTHEHARQLFAASLSGPLIMKRLLQGDAPKTLLLAGDDDPIIPYRSVKLGARLLGMEFETVRKGGHCFLLTRPEAMARRIETFLDEPER